MAKGTTITLRDGTVQHYPDLFPSVSDSGPDTMEVALCDADSGVHEIIDMDDVDAIEWRRK